jgi:hypothetical protein
MLGKRKTSLVPSNGPMKVLEKEAALAAPVAPVAPEAAAAKALSRAQIAATDACLFATRGRLWDRARFRVAKKKALAAKNDALNALVKAEEAARAAVALANEASRTLEAIKKYADAATDEAARAVAATSAANKAPRAAAARRAAE